MSRIICTKCKEDKVPSDFSTDRYKLNNKKSACKECSSIAHKEWRESNIEVVRRRDRVTHYIRTYGLSEETAIKLVDDRTGVCEICKSVDKMIVDHCHATEKVRGMICQPCNSVLGYSKDNISTLSNAIQYLQEFYDE